MRFLGNIKKIKKSVKDGDPTKKAKKPTDNKPRRKSQKKEGEAEGDKAKA